MTRVVAGTHRAIVRMPSVIFWKVMPPSGLVPDVPVVAVASATGAAAATRVFSFTYSTRSLVTGICVSRSRNSGGRTSPPASSPTTARSGPGEYRSDPVEIRLSMRDASRQLAESGAGRVRRREKRARLLTSRLSAPKTTRPSQVREQRGWRQEDVAARARAAGFNWKADNVQAIERGFRYLSVEELFVLPALFDVMLPVVFSESYDDRLLELGDECAATVLQLRRCLSGSWTPPVRAASDESVPGLAERKAALKFDIEPGDDHAPDETPLRSQPGRRTRRARDGMARDGGRRERAR